MSNPPKDLLWYKNAIFYELSLKAFKDGNNDGMGDFIGLTQKLDYLKDLGITCIWILPFYPSPWKDDGYDVSDYYDIHTKFGNIQDFEKLITEAHSRNIRVIIELIINHTSDKHPWFQEAKKSVKSPKRNYYVWSDTNSKYKDVRVIFIDTESSNWTFDPHSKQYYWHRFYSHQPDLNFESPLVQKEMFKIIDFWFEKGLDGFRIDAAPYLYEEEGTSCESLPATHEFIQKIRAHIDDKYSENVKILLAEANQMPEDTMPYFGDETNEFHMAFYFPLMPRLFLALAKKDATPIKEIILKTKDTPKQCQWCTFLRNHDELTLEMVSNDVREYMWNYYAPNQRMRLNLGIRRRLTPLLDNNRKKIEFMNSLLFSLPGSPVIYYGDEIGMGDNINLNDRDGLRTPMQWSKKKNAGFSEASKEKLYLPVIETTPYNPKFVNVEDQLQDPNSLLNFYRKLIKTRKTFPILAMGNINFLKTNHEGVLAFVRELNNDQILIIHNFLEKEFSSIITEHTLSGTELELVFPLKNKNVITITDPLHIKLDPFGYEWWRVRNQ